MNASSYIDPKKTISQAKDNVIGKLKRMKDLITKDTGILLQTHERTKRKQNKNIK